MLMVLQNHNCNTVRTRFGTKREICCFRLVLEGEPGRKLAESRKLEFSEKILANKFAL